MSHDSEKYRKMAEKKQKRYVVIRAGSKGNKYILETSVLSLDANATQSPQLIFHWVCPSLVSDLIKPTFLNQAMKTKVIGGTSFKPLNTIFCIYRQSLFSSANRKWLSQYFQERKRREECGRRNEGWGDSRPQKWDRRYQFCPRGKKIPRLNCSL